MKSANIIAIETSCDETAASVLRGNLKSKRPQFEFLSSVIKSQIPVHKKTGGIVPEVAARAHMANILPVTQMALAQAKLGLADLNYIAVTTGPGLIGSLIVGTEFAKGLAASLGLPILPTNHMSGHLYSVFATPSLPPTRACSGKARASRAPHEGEVQVGVKFPLLSIVVSGGHTMLVLMKDFAHYQVIGQTVDDAAGEAFDKVARLLGLPYPGGPEISKLTRLGKTDLNFPRPMLHDKNFNFSFAGLKTSVLYYLDKQKRPLSKQHKADVAMSFENAVVDVLTQKALRAINQYHCKTVSVAGGVAANTALRQSLAILAKANQLTFLAASPELCGDNAQMIALAAYFNLRAGGKPVPAGKVHANPAWELS